ncbi:MAG: RNA methyltransferase [Desulfosudaceae bacterium]
MTLKPSSPAELYLALLHYPVINKSGEVVASAVTNLDLHDIARAARTYGAAGFYVVTPLEDQQALVERIVTHWTAGGGSRYNPKRAEAMALIRVQRTLDDTRDDIVRNGGQEPAIVLTSARSRQPEMNFEELRSLLTRQPVLLVFGTAWGLADEVLGPEGYPVLTPIEAGSDYNHLSVRSAASIILDRLIANKI